MSITQSALQIKLNWTEIVLRPSGLFRTKILTVLCCGIIFFNVLISKWSCILIHQSMVLSTYCIHSCTCLLDTGFILSWTKPDLSQWNLTNTPTSSFHYDFGWAGQKFRCWLHFLWSAAKQKALALAQITSLGLMWFLQCHVYISCKDFFIGLWATDTVEGIQLLGL